MFYNNQKKPIAYYTIENNSLGIPKADIRFIDKRTLADSDFATIHKNDFANFLLEKIEAFLIANFGADLGLSMLEHLRQDFDSFPIEAPEKVIFC